MTSNFTLRLATAADVSTLAQLIPASVRALQGAYYSPEQMEAALGPVFGVDAQLIEDGTYFIAEHETQIVGCGGWSRRPVEYGGYCHRAADDNTLDPSRDPARIRAFFVPPEWARRGIGKMILSACESALIAAGFREAVMVATLAGEPLYAAFGYTVIERYEVPLGEDLSLPVVRMGKSF